MDDTELRELFEKSGEKFSSYTKEAINKHFEKILLDKKDPEIYFDWGTRLIALAKINFDETLYWDAFEKREL
jgi:hypothetical protein